VNAPFPFLQVDESLQMPERRAIIDIGSNTIRLVIYGGPRRAPTVVLNEKVGARLGKDLDRTGHLSERAMGVALAGLGRYAALLRLLGVEDVQTVATAATRDALNGGVFLERVRMLGLEPRLLSGDEEAHASALGVIGAFPGARGVVADLGGGSLELVRIDGDAIAHGISLPFGTLRLPGLRAGGVRKFASRLDEALAHEAWSEGTGLPLFLVGGSWRAFSRYALHLEAQAHASALDDPHGLELTPEAAQRMAATLVRTGAPARVAGITEARLASLADAAALLVQLVRRLGPSKLVFSSWGLREGLLYAGLDPATQRQDPLLASIGGFAQRYGVSEAMASMVADWAAPAAGGTAGSEPLRYAAAMLTLAAQRTEPNLRCEEGLDWALRKRWIGLENRDRARLAAAVIGNAGLTTVPADVAELAPPEEIREGIGWGLAIRLSRKLCASAAPALANSGISVENGQLVLTLLDPAVPLYTESAARSHRALADWLGFAPRVNLGVRALVSDRV
jgi:exopolyphosphatase/guanosine-5'-triphosphate,3'-diphosphate pyrophosphatase